MSDVKKKVSKVSKKPTMRRQFLENGAILSDFFVLSAAKMAKLVGIIPKGTNLKDRNEMMSLISEPTIFQWVDHQHFFYTFDPDGRQLTTSTHIGGHFHIIEIEETGDENEPVKVVSVSKPMKWARKKVGNKFKKVAVAALEVDEHTHEAKYVKTDRVERRKVNVEVAKMQSAEANKVAGVPGIR